ncbi:MAG: hypothetical protein EBU53_05030 [Proteobacteria bacterium]|jgi:hypothetical protein|nr:hypothetical protein [Pseudomonadota bacterium]
MKKTPSKTSPKGGKRGCICKDGTYNSKCCDGSLEAQGIGSTVNQVTSSVTNTNAPRTITGVNG